MNAFTAAMLENTSDPVEPIDNRPAVKRLYLEQAASRQIFCPDCGTLLDVGDDCTGYFGHLKETGNVVLFHVEGSRHQCLCASCFDQLPLAKYRSRGALTVWDSREKQSYTLPIAIRETAEQTTLKLER